MLNKFGILVMVLAFSLAGCSTSGGSQEDMEQAVEDQYFEDVAEQAATDWAIEQDAERYETWTEEQNDLEHSQDTSEGLPFIGILQCGDAESYAGTSITCTISRAHCSYQPGTSGSPTFCNDAPYPNHDFTLVAWDDDWSEYDGKCIVVNGTVSIYSGKPQIEAFSRSQVSNCP